MNHGDLEQARQLLRRAWADGVPPTSRNRFHIHQYRWLIELLTGDFDAVREVDREARATFGSGSGDYTEAMMFSTG
jgi:hypothetical protein